LVHFARSANTDGRPKLITRHQLNLEEIKMEFQTYSPQPSGLISNSNQPKHRMRLLSAGIVPLLLLLAAGPSASAQTTLSPTTLSFANLAVGVTSTARMATLRNTQPVPLVIYSIAIAGGTAPGDFASGGTCPISPSTLAAGKSCTIPVTFTPSALGTRTATLTITHNASTSPQSVALTGNGIAPVTISRPSLTFSSLLVGSTSPAEIVTLLNHLNTDLAITSVAATGDFAVASNTCGSSVGPAGRCTIGVTFTPTALGSREGILTISYNAFGSPSLVTLTGTGNDNGLTSITVAPANPSIVAGSALQFTATGRLRNGSMQNLTGSVAWNSSASSVATITTGGLASGVTTGTSTISATLGAIVGSTTLTVTPPTLLSIAVTPVNPSIQLGGTQQFTATGTYSNGTTQNLTATATWLSSTPSVATILPGGLATGAAAGASIISATMNSITGSTTLTVTPPTLLSIAVTPVNPSIPLSGTQQFTAIGTYSDTSTQDLTSTVTWSSSALGVATIGTTGLASAVGLGQTTIEATSGTINGSTTLTVTAGFVLTGSLNTARYVHTSTLLNNGLVLIAGGCDDTGAMASAELYDPATGTFTPTGNLNSVRCGQTATLLDNGLVLIAGGDGSAGPLANAELYDPATGTFTSTGSLNTARVGHTATLLDDGMVLIAGGYGTGGYAQVAELYDPATGIFTPTGSLPYADSDGTATLLDNGMVLIAGASDVFAELFNPATGTFIATGNMNYARESYATATLLNNGMVLIAGGVGSSGGMATAELYDPASGTFTVTGSLTTARHTHTSTLLNNGLVLIAGGFDSSNNLSASAELYDPATGMFSSTGGLNFARDQASATLLNDGNVLVAGGIGNGGSVLASAELFEPATLTPPNLVSIAVVPATPTVSPGATQQLVATGTFSDASTQQLASVTWSSSDPTVAQISNDASNHGAAIGVAPGTVTITATAGTVTGSASLTVKPTGTFATTASLNTGRLQHTSTPLMNGIVLIAGGSSASGSPLASAELYDPATATFTLTGSLTTARSQHTATLLNNGMVLITGGIVVLNPSTSAELYDPTSGTFTPTGNMNFTRANHNATLLNNGKVLITGGSFSGPDTAELYDPETGIFTTTGNLITPRISPSTATLLNNGMVLVAGGAGTDGYLASAELYDPVAGTFTATGSLVGAREQHSATLLNNGMVLIAGGFGPNATGGLSSAELYDPTTGTFTATGSMNTARKTLAATLLNNGMVLISGGANGSFPSSLILDSAELYDPSAGTFSFTGNLNVARQLHTATLLSDGMVLIAGGNNLAGPIATAELY
jgi:Bacterial Ig-like domain (group 2)/Abnormal spindle-like microcephaly-assoc'd, ASPM-SPD-2-Hydin/Galactose oxidase, central domain